jgi:hypothetical protein
MHAPITCLSLILLLFRILCSSGQPSRFYAVNLVLIRIKITTHICLGFTAKGSVSSLVLFPGDSLCAESSSEPACTIPKVGILTRIYSVVVKALCYKPESRGLETRLGEFIFQFT